MTGLSVPEVLRLAEAVIGERGWCADDYTDSQGRVCAAGAINVAIWGGPWESDEADPVARDLKRGAVEALSDEVGASVATWNDTDGRTADEVRAALLRAADRAVTE